MFPDEIEQRNAILAAIIDSSEDAIISKDLNGIVQSWNKAAQRLFGYTEGEMIGTHISILIPCDRRAEEVMIISNLKAGNRIEHYETIRLHKDGKELNISLTVSPIKNNEGKVTGASKIARDISIQKEAAAMRDRYARQLETINETARYLAAEIEESKILQQVTDDTTRLSGAAFGAFFYNKTDVHGESFMLFALSGLPREAFEKFGMPRNTAVFSKTFNGEGIFRSNDITKDARYGKNSPHQGMPVGHPSVVSYLAVPVIAPGGAVIGGLVFGHPEFGKFTDEHEKLVQAISGMAALALDKARVYEEIKNLNSRKDEFISFASHELKTPLTTIKGYLQLAEKLPEMGASLLPKLDKQVGRLSAIIGDLLDLSKIQAGALDLNIAPISINGLLQDNIETAKATWPLHLFRSEIPEEEIVVQVDGQKINQVIANLLNNACKYSPSTSTVILSCFYYGDTISITVTDHGRGIADNMLKQIFNRFFRIADRFEKTEGLGLGLYICREIVEAHHGTIWAESEVGRGSAFTVELPAHYQASHTQA